MVLLRNIASKDIDLLLDISPDIPKISYRGFSQIAADLTHLVSIPLKFTEKGFITAGVKKISVSPDQAKLSFFVKDTGIGIPGDRIDTLFEAFTQADASTTRKYGGTGLGLAICKLLTEIMGGNIRAESESGRGITFLFFTQF